MAMQHIIAQGLTEPDGSLKTKKKAKLGTAVKVESNGSGVRKGVTFSQKVNGRFDQQFRHLIELDVLTDYHHDRLIERARAWSPFLSTCV